MKRMPRGLRAQAMCIGINQGNESDFDYVLGQVNTTRDGTLKSDLIAGLSCTKDALLHLRLLDYQLKNKTADVLVSLINIASRPGLSYVTSWNYLKANWDFLYSKLFFSLLFVILIVFDIYSLCIFIALIHQLSFNR